MRPLVLFLLGLMLLQAEEQPQKRLIGKSDEVSLTDKVVVIPIGQKDLINKQAFRFWNRTIDRAVEEKARAIVLEIDTPGGLAFDTRDIITDKFGKLELPLVSWVKREALSAGALIAFSTDRIYMAPGTTIGSAGIINGTGQEIEQVTRAKLESAFEASFRPVVKKKGHRLDVLQAMMFVDEENERTFGSVTVRKGGLLNLTASEAVEQVDGKPLLAAGIAESLEEVLKVEELDGAEMIRPEPTGFEMFAWWVAAFSPLFIALGLGAAYLELKAPGFGVFGFIALGIFAVFFFGNSVAGNLAGYELMAVFLLGVALVLLEIFVLPGMVAGIIGAVLMIGSLWFAMADRIDFERVSEGVEDAPTLSKVLFEPGLYLTYGLLGTVALMLLFIRFLPSIPLFRGLVADEALASGSGDDGHVPGSFVGATAVVVSDLRPTGTIVIDGMKKDAISDRGLIEKGTEVRIVKEGMTYHVEPIESGDA
jgi:membrane-bound serine protease (ClpP class)